MEKLDCSIWLGNDKIRNGGRKQNLKGYLMQ